MGLGLWIASSIGPVLNQNENLIFLAHSPLLIYSVMGILGFSLGFYSRVQNKEKRERSVPERIEKKVESFSSVKVLDTSSIIDQRIIDMCETGFVEGVIMVPQFVLNELQHIADSTNHVKRARGRRGLIALNRLKESAESVKIVEKDYANIPEVDHKLIRLCRDFNASLITTDYNLNKRASLENVKVLNVNELANVLKPVIVADEVIRVSIIKEGRESHQGVGYLDDGTMIIVDNGREHVGKTVNVTVTSVLQTPAGKMVFARVSKEQNDTYYMQEKPLGKKNRQNGNPVKPSRIRTVLS
jgi:uncharacterized protein YacL